MHETDPNTSVPMADATSQEAPAASTAQEAVNRAEDDTARVLAFSFDIASGMLESLGLNMYTSIGKSLSEFVANAYDAEASTVEITIPFDRIVAERTALRERAKREVLEKTREKFTVLTDPLPDTVEIVIKDDGHGMSPQGIQDKFLIINRNRRQVTAKSETGKRDVMGRKGLGKLAGFGTAERITIWSKRANTTFATQFTMDYSKIKEQDKVHESSFKAEYFDNQPPALKGTRITLSGLRCDSLKASRETIEEAMSQNFAIFDDSFKVSMNGQPVEELPSQYEYVYPPAEQLVDGLGTKTVEVNEMFSFDIRYIVRFRARDTDDKLPAEKDHKGRDLRRGPLPTLLRGARIYCHGRLAAGPTLLKLQTGMHNFHAQSYMECVVHADEIDKQVMDFIGTNRADLKGDSDVVEALRDSVTEIMRVALYEHSKFRDDKVEKLVEEDDFTKGLLDRIDTMPRNIKTHTKTLLKTLASVQGITSPLYRSTAPLVLQSMNAGEVLTNLIRLEADPTSLQVVAHELLELARVENSDVLKLYRGRRAGVEAVRALCDKARENWKKGSRFESELHLTLKDNPWLLGPDFNRCLTSDKPLADVARELTEVLKVDEFAPKVGLDADGNIPDENDRPDLVFVTIDNYLPRAVNIIELKSPNLALRKEHYDQLDSYRFRVEQWLKAKYNGHSIAVKCLLIGDLDVQSTSQPVMMLNELAANQGPHSPITILPLRLLLERAKQTHIDAITVATNNEEFYEAELSTTAPAPSKKASAVQPTPANPSAPAPEGEISASPGETVS